MYPHKMKYALREKARSGAFPITNSSLPVLEKVPHSSLIHSILPARPDAAPFLFSLSSTALSFPAILFTHEDEGMLDFGYRFFLHYGRISHLGKPTFLQE